MGFTVNDFDPQIRIYGTDGVTLLCEANRGNSSGSKNSAEIAACQVPGDGEYTIVASDYQDNDTGGDYNLTNPVR